MSTTKKLTSVLAVAAVLGLTGACTGVVPSPDVNPASPDAGADATPEDPADADATPEDRYRLDLECPPPGTLQPC